MNTLAALLAVTASLAITGCSRDPLAVSRKHVVSGDAYATQGKYAEAAIEYRNAAKAAPSAPDPHARLGRLAMQAGDVDATTTEYLRAADLDAASAPAQVRAASAELLAGRYADARDRAEAALRLAPNDADARVALGDALAGLHDPARSQARLLEAVRLAPQSADAHRALGNMYWSAGRLADADAELTRAAQLAPEQIEANRTLALFAAATGQPARAVRPLLLLTRHEETRTPARLALADVEESLGKRPAALGLLTLVIRDHPANVAAVLRRAQLLSLDGRHDEALAAVEAANRIEEDSARVMLVRAELLIRQGQVDGGIWWAMRMRERHPDELTPALRVALGQIFEAGGRSEAAAQQYAAALEASPRNWVAANNLAWIYAREERFGEALPLARLAHTLAPERPEVNDTLAAILRRADSRSTAAADVR